MTANAPNQRKKRNDLSELEKRRVWVLAGGRCVICKRYLLEGDLTGFTVSLGEVAHIVGQAASSKSPRGLDSLPVDQRDTADNAVLLCPEHHAEVDDGGIEVLMPVEKLRAVKQQHEEFIRYATGLDEHRRTVVLRMVGQLHGNAVELRRPTTTAAVLGSTDRYPDFSLCHDRHGIEIDLRSVARETKHDAGYYAAALSMIDDVVDYRVRDAIAKDAVAHMSVFAWARLPLLVYLGSKLDDTVEVDVYQRHRDPDSWAWPTTGTATNFDVVYPATTSDVVGALIVNVSGTIRPAELPPGLRDQPIFVIAPTDATPATDTISSRATLEAFTRSLRLFFSQIEERWKHLRTLHVFAAAPISAAVQLGRAHDPIVHPQLVLYDRQDGAYEKAITIPSTDVQDSATMTGRK